MRNILWTEEQTKILREMRGRDCDFEEIAKVVGRTKTSVKERWRWINMPEHQKKRRRASLNAARAVRQGWTRAEMDRLLEARDVYKQSWDEIAVLLGRPNGTVYSKYYYLKNLYTGPRESIGSVQVPAPIAQEWRTRLALAPRDITAALMGDPLPGYSALERRA